VVSQPRFVILEDHPLVREALAERLVRHLGDVDFVYTGDSVSAALAAIEGRGVDCVVMDLDLNDSVSPIVNVVSLAETGAPVLIVSALGDGVTIRAAFTAGVIGFLSKSAEPEEFIAAIEAALRGDKYTSAEAAAAMLADSDSLVDLSDQERRAMVLYASGLKMRAVARHMGVSESTAREYIRRLRAKYEKAGAPLPSKTELYRMAQREGILP
jgi:two-component system, NarL family, nitrate/nitrite response regulator NarL